MIQLDLSIRAALATIAADTNASAANRGIASAAMLLSHNAGMLQPGEPMEAIDFSIAIMFVPTNPLTSGMSQDATVALASDVAVWSVRVNQRRLTLGLLFPAAAPPNVPINFEMDTGNARWAGALNNLFLLTSVGASALAPIRELIPLSARLWKLDTSDGTWSTTTFSAAYAEADPDDGGNRLAESSRSSTDDLNDDNSTPIAAQERVSADLANFALALPSFDPAVLGERLAPTRPVAELYPAIANRFLRQTAEMRMGLNEKQVKAWIGAELRQGGVFSLASLSPTRAIGSIDELTQATAALIEGETTLRGDHMHVIGKAFWFLIRNHAKQREFGPTSIATLIENRMARLREPAPASDRSAPQSRIEEAVARAEAAFAFNKNSDDLVEMQRFPIPDGRPTKRNASPIERPFTKRSRNDLRATRTISIPDRFRKFENVCYSWLEDANRGTMCAKRACRWKHAIPTNAAPAEVDEFRRYLTLSDAERLKI